MLAWNNLPLLELLLMWVHSLDSKVPTDVGWTPLSSTKWLSDPHLDTLLGFGAVFGSIFYSAKMNCNLIHKLFHSWTGYHSEPTVVGLFHTHIYLPSTCPHLQILQVSTSANQPFIFAEAPDSHTEYLSPNRAQCITA